MKVSDLQGLKVVSTPTISTADMNNPFNMKVGSETQQYIQQGQASVGRAAPDGGNFLTFKDRNTAINAAKNLLFSSGTYKGLTVDAALKKWSNNGYSGDLIPALSSKDLATLTPDEQTQVLNAMETKGENDAVSTSTKRVSDFKPGQLSVVNSASPQPPTPQKPQSFMDAMKSGAETSFGDTMGEVTGLAKSAASQVQGLGQLGLKATDALGITKNAGNSTFSSDPNALVPKGAAEKVGSFAGDVAPYLMGIGEEEATTQAPKIAKYIANLFGKSAGDVLPAVTKFLAQHTIQGAVNTTIGTAQTGDPVKGAEIGVGGEILGTLGTAAKGFGEQVFKASLPTSAGEAKLLQSYKANKTLAQRVASFFANGESKGPTTMGDTAFKKGLMGTESMIGIQGKRAANTLWTKLISPALKASKAVVDMPSFFGEAEQKIISENPELSRQGDLLNALESLKEDYKGVKNATMNDLQKFKEGWAKFVPEKAYKGKPIAGAFNDVKDIVSGLARTKIYDALGNDVKQAYFDYGNLKSVQEFGQKAMTGGKLKGGAGSFISGLKDKLVTPIGTIGGKAIYKTGQGLEFIGAAGAKAMSDLWDEWTKPKS